MPAIARTDRLIWLLAVLLIVVQVCITGLALLFSHRSALESRGELVAEAARSAEAGVSSAFLQTDALLIGVGEILRSLAQGDDLAGPAVARLLETLRTQSFSAGDLLLYDADGRLLNGAQRGARQRSAQMHGALLSALRSDPLAGLVFGPPAVNERTREWGLALGRRIVVSGDRSYLAIAELGLHSLLDRFQPGATQSGVRVELFSLSGQLIAAAPHDELRTGTFAGLPDPTVGGQGASSYRIRGEGEGAVVESVRRLSNRPFAVRAYVDRDRALAQWYDDARKSAALSVFFMLAVAGGAFAMSRVSQSRAAAVARSQELANALESAIESMTDGFALFDAEDRLVAWNSRYLEFFPHLKPVLQVGVPFAKLAETAARAVLPDADEARLRDWVEWRVALHREGKSDGEQVLANGRRILTTVWRTSDGRVASVHRDVTRQRDQEAALLAARDAAESANRAKSAFLANMSHELRTPLNAILGFSAVIRDRIFGDKAIDRYGEYAADIHRSGEHLLSIINDILDLSKIEADRVEVSTAPLEVRDLLDDCLTVVRSAARTANVALRCEGPHQRAIQADGRLLKQVLFNLLSNAIKFTPAGGEVRLSAAPRDGGIWRFEVADSGIGISEEAVARVFEPFNRGDADVARKFGGTGLGLHIVKRIVTLMGGTVGIDSKVGAGTRVWLDIPAEEVPAERGDDRQASPARRLNRAAN